MKYDVLSHDPVADGGAMIWTFRGRATNARKALEYVNALIERGYDRELSIQVNQVEPRPELGYGIDVYLPGEEQAEVIAKGVCESAKKPKQKTFFGD